MIFPHLKDSEELLLLHYYLLLLTFLIITFLIFLIGRVEFWGIDTAWSITFPSYAILLWRYLFPYLPSPPDVNWRSLHIIIDDALQASHCALKWLYWLYEAIAHILTVFKVQMNVPLGGRITIQLLKICYLLRIYF